MKQTSLRGDDSARFVQNRDAAVGGDIVTLCTAARLGGTYVSVEPFHLASYVDEQAFRFNNRKTDDADRFIKALALVPTARLTYKELIRAEQA